MVENSAHLLPYPRVTSALMLLVIVATASNGCATHRTLVPVISEPPRTSILLENPVLLSILDARPEKSRTDEVVASLQEGLSRTYGSSIEWVNYFEPVPEGRVAVRIRLMALGADFGSRIVTSTTIANAFTTANATASGTWGTVIGKASSQQTLLASSFSGEGWWIGTAWMNLEIEDRLPGHSEQFVVPIVAEHTKSNIGGYLSGDRAAKRAWDSARQVLVMVLDQVLVTVRDRER